MKIRSLAVFVISILGSGSIFAAPYVQDTGKIKNLYVSVGGNIAIQLDNGFPNSSSGGQCTTASINSFGGNVVADPIFKSTLLAAKAAQQTITVTVQGCEANGAWFKIIDVYVN